jgi:hypothetical protein
LVPISVVIALSSYVLGKQIIRPHHRMIKALLLLLVVIIVMKFEMVYAVYFFVVLFPFPSGIVLTNSNVIFLTLITLVWMVRARATGKNLFEKTDVDIWILLFLAAYIVSLFNVELTSHLIEGVKLIWRQLTAFALFYMIVMFVDDERKLERMTKLIALAGTLVALTGVVELFAPGFSLIPGWIQADPHRGVGRLGFRLEGIRIGGALGAHGLLSDYCAFTLFFMVFHFLRSKNPIEKTFWFGASIMAVAVIMATANRGGVLSLLFGLVYSLWVFRRYMNLLRYVILITAVVTVFTATQLALDKYTIAVSMTKRVLGTQLVRGVPETRGTIWQDTFRRSLDHVIIGHGPYFPTSRGLEKQYWPHNGYLYYLYTLGLFGLTAFLMIVYRLFRISLRYRQPLIAKSFVGAILSILNVQLAVFLVGQVRTDHQRHTDFVYIYIVWMLFGLIVAVGKMVTGREAEVRERAMEGDSDGQAL